MSVSLAPCTYIYELLALAAACVGSALQRGPCALQKRNGGTLGVMAVCEESLWQNGKLRLIAAALKGACFRVCLLL